MNKVSLDINGGKAKSPSCPEAEMLNALAAFLASSSPGIGQVNEDVGYRIDISEEVEEAREKAVVAAYLAVARIASHAA